jgi:quercetin dioxygenase-like cupin family protein
MKAASLIVALVIASLLAVAHTAPAAQQQQQHHDHAHAGVSVEDATVSLPDTYKVQFENEWVKVTRVHYAPHAKLPAHSHPALASAYVYLNNSGPVVFRHVDGNRGAITRQPTLLGSFRLFRAVPGEIHEVENQAALPSDFLRVEFKTDPVDPPTLRGKYLPEPTFDEPLQKVQFENGQVRITRLFWPRGKSLELAGGPHPSLLVSLTEGERGRLQWVPAGQSHRLDNNTLPTMEGLRFEFKSGPIELTHP